MGDRIELRGLRLMALCGVLPEEQDRPQPFAVDVDLECDLREAGRTDDLGATIDYGDVCDRVAAVAATGRYALMERLAEAIAGELLGVGPLDAVTVRVEKLRPPVAHDLSSAAVRVRRVRGDRGSGS